MRPIPPFEQVLPIFRFGYEALLTRFAKVSFIAAVTFPLIGGLFAAPLLIATRFGNNREAEQHQLVKYGFAPLGTIGIGFCCAGLVAVGSLALCILFDLTHKLTIGRHAMSYRYVFFPFRFNFIDFNALIK
ncbi:hypothetical protein [Simkania sp.]|uniref:hypothetical protein n=1 Tax=Simkania sp. TaxID=34094 RepID=UPI003B52E954